MDFKTYLDTSAAEVEQELQQILNSWKDDVEEVSPKLTRFANLFIEASQGGKRLRGALVKLGFEMAGGKGKEILKPAAAFEIFQTAILAHDDVIDLSPLRRGKPTIFKQLGEDHYATSQTIALGDIGFFLALEQINASDFPDDIKKKATQTFIQIMYKTGFGQLFDIELPLLAEKGEEDVLKVSELKTAWYTIIGPLELGAIHAGASQELISKIRKFGINLGIAFQIQDDILGIFGDEETIGKSVTSDIEEGKITLLLSFAKEHGSEEEKQTLADIYGVGKITDEDPEKIRELFKNSGALEYATRKALEYVDQAKKVIEIMDIKDTHKNLLLEMADFLVKRDK